MKKIHAGMAKRFLSACLLTYPAISHAAGPVAVPPELSTGALQLVFREGVDPAKLDTLVADTRKRSTAMRAMGAKEELAKDPAKISMPWLNDWIMAALYQADRAKDANAAIRNLRTKAKPPAQDDGAPDPSGTSPPPKQGNPPDTKSSAAVEAMSRLNAGAAGIRWLVMFGRNGEYPGRLEPDVESDLLQDAWQFCHDLLDPGGSLVAKMTRFSGHPYEILPLSWGRMWGTENQDIRMRPYVYLALSALCRNPDYAGKTIAGKSLAQWLGIMGGGMKHYLKDRVLTGLWIEPGSHYAHITFDVMIDLREAAPDPDVRQLAKMFLDLALIEDEQLSVNGVRGGARSRAGPLGATTGKFKDLVFGDAPGVMISDYQAPPVAIALRHAMGAASPYQIHNRLPGEKTESNPDYLHNSHLISYAYRTQGFLMGTALRDPNLTYHPTSDQQRTSSVIFQSNEAVYASPKVIPHASASGRSNRESWGVQCAGAMVVQKLLKSRFVDRLDACFTANLKITERDGWIFAEAGSGSAAVRVVDPRQPNGAGKYSWYDIHPKAKERLPFTIKAASPERDFLPIIIQAGDRSQYASSEKFQQAVLASRITIKAEASELEYQPAGGPVITWNYRQDADPLVLPRVDGKTPDLQPAMLFDSPFLKARWGDPIIHAGAGPFRAVYDMENFTVNESLNPSTRP